RLELGWRLHRATGDRRGPRRCVLACASTARESSGRRQREEWHNLFRPTTGNGRVANRVIPAAPRPPQACVEGPTKSLDLPMRRGVRTTPFPALPRLIAGPEAGFLFQT